MVDLHAQIADHIEALCDPRHHAEPRWEWDANRHRKPLPPHRTVVPGLIQQLRSLTEPGTDGGIGTRGGPETVPVAIDAVSLLASITHGAAKRCLDAGITTRDTPEGNLRQIIGSLPTIDRDTQHLIRRELASWQNQAEIIAGWKLPPVELRAPCPALIDDPDTGDVAECGSRGTLLAAPDGSQAWCAACRAEWDASTVGVLARYVTAYREGAEATRAAARVKAAAERRHVEEPSGVAA